MKAEIVNGGDKIKGMTGSEEIHGGARVGGNGVTFTQGKTLPDPMKAEIVNGGEKVSGMAGSEEVHGAAAVGGTKVKFVQ